MAHPQKMRRTMTPAMLPRLVLTFTCCVKTIPIVVNYIAGRTGLKMGVANMLIPARAPPNDTRKPYLFSVLFPLFTTCDCIEQDSALISEIKMKFII